MSFLQAWLTTAQEAAWLSEIAGYSGSKRSTQVAHGSSKVVVLGVAVLGDPLVPCRCLEGRDGDVQAGLLHKVVGYRPAGLVALLGGGCILLLPYLHP